MPAKRRSGHVTDQESIVRADCCKAPDGAAAQARSVPKTSGRLWISPYSAGQDPSATRQGQPATVASRNQGRAYPGTRPAPIAVLDVIKASEEAPRDAIDGRPGRHFESVPGYTNCTWSAKSSRMHCVGLGSRTSRNKPPPPPTATMLGAAEASASERRWIAADLYARSGCCEI